MTITYDPHHAKYLDPTDARAERDRVFDLCHGCRLCWNLCPSFESLFDLIDNAHGDDPHALTDAEHDRITDECYQCKLCAIKCPYVPPHEWALDFPRLLLRSLAIQRTEGKISRSADLLAKTDLQGKVASVLAPVVNASTKVGIARVLMEKTTGISRERLLPSFSKVKFSTWFKKRTAVLFPGAPIRDRAVLFPTCIVEYQEPGIGQALVGVLERNGVGCDLPAGMVCCGMPYLDAGDIEKFTANASKNVAILAPLAKAGRAIVVPQPTCGYVLKNEYPQYLGTEDSKLVASQTKDACEHLMALHRTEPLSTEFIGKTYATITWHAACHQRAQSIGPKSRDLIALTGAQVTVVEKCSGIDGTWGLRAENVVMARKVAVPLMGAVRDASSDLVAGDCHLANGAIAEATGERPVHPVQVLARAYGLRDS